MIDLILMVVVGLCAPTGYWPDADGNLQPLRCPTPAEYSRVTKLPALCAAERPCACYTLDEHVRVVGAVGGLQAQVHELREGLTACSGKSAAQARDVLLLRDVVEDLQRDKQALALQIAQQPEPPSRLVWASVGAGGAAVVFGALVYALAQAGVF